MVAPRMFSVVGPLEVPITRAKAGRLICDMDGRDFWERHEPLGQRTGCYIFAIRAGRGVTPLYVGRATKRFRQETFTYHKLARYNEGLIDYARGTPVLFFVVSPQKRGRVNSGDIRALEDFLIEVAIARNPYLLNILGTKAVQWGINGILRGRSGKPAEAAVSFKRMMGL